MKKSFLARNYWERHGTFAGFEKTILASFVPTDKDAMEELYKTLGTASKAEFEEKVDAKGINIIAANAVDRDKVLSAARLILHYLVSDSRCIYTLDSEEFTAPLFTWQAGSISRKTFYLAVKEKLSTLSIIQGGNTVQSVDCFEVEADPVAVVRAVKKLLIIVGRCREFAVYPQNLLALVLENRDFKLRVLAATYGVSVADILGLFDLKLPDLLACYEQFGRAFVVLENDSVLVYHDDGSIETVSTFEMQARIQQRNISLNALEQINAF